MSKFSDSLNEIIKEYEPLNIYNIAKEIGCDRSWLQKVVSGDRKMNYEFIRPLCDLLQNHLDPAEIVELYEQFAQDYFGNTRYEVLQYLKNRLHYMGKREEEIKRFISAKSFDLNDFVQTFLIQDKFVDLIQKIYHMIGVELEEAKKQNRKPILYLYIPSYWRFVRNLLIILCNRDEVYKNLDFKCVFSGSMELRSKEIAQLENFLSAYEFAIYNLNVCDIMESKSNYISLDLLPYYIITSNQMLLLPDDGEMYVDVREQKMIERMTAKYLSEVCHKNLFWGKLDESIYLNRLTATKIENDKSYVIGNHVCMEAFLEVEDMTGFVGENTHYPDLALATAIQFYQNMQNSDLNMVFSSQTMYESMMNKIHDGFTNKKILQIWEKIYQHYVEHPEKQIYIFDRKRYRFHSGIHLDLLAERAILALNNYEVGKSLLEKNMVVLPLPKAIECFRDFFIYFTQSDICMNREQTLQMIKMYIETKRKEICDEIVEK